MTPARALPLALALLTLPLGAEAPKEMILGDPALKLELFATFPEVETPTTVTGAPDGSVYVGNDPRDSRLNTKEPECTIVRFTGQGSARKKTVFARQLYSPAGMLWHDGWLYVIHDPLLTRFKDTDGDGVADVREDLVTDLGVPPNEGLNDHVVSGFTLGMDGFFYISVGDRGVYQAKGKDGSTVTLLGGGIVRCRPDGTGLEIYSGGTRNHLEVDLDAMDRPFTLDNTDDGNGWWTRLQYHVESGYYGYPFYYRADQTNGLLAAGPQKPQPWPGAPAGNEHFLPAMTDFGGGSPTGGLCYLSDGLPDVYRGQLFFSEWGQQKLSVIQVARDGAGFHSVKNDPLLQPEKGASFRPMELSVASDGSLLIADWGFGGWKAPKQLGSIWRLSWPEAKTAPRLAEAEKAGVPELIAALNHPDRDQRLRAEWALVHRGASAWPALVEVLHRADAPEVQKAHALWTMDLLGETSPELRGKASGLIRQVLADRSPAIRAQAVRALGTRWVKEAAGDLAALLTDADAEVRMQAAIALGRIGAPGFGAALVKTLSDEDRTVRFTARIAAAKLGEWAALEPLLKAQDSRASEQAWLAFTWVFDPNAVAVLTKLAADPSPALRARAAEALGQVAWMPKEWDGHWWGTQPVKSPRSPGSVAWTGTAPAAEALSKALADQETEVRLAAAKALAQGVGTEALPALRARLTAETDPAVRRQLIETLGIQKDTEAIGTFARIALDEKAEPEFRETAIAAVAGIGGDEAKKMIVQLASAQLTPAATLKVVETAGEMKVLEAAPALIGRLQSDSPGLRLAAVKALASLGSKAKAAEGLTGVLHDKENKVVVAALEALSSLHDPASLPALLELAKKNRSKEMISALASIQDPQTIPFLVQGLRDNNVNVRRTAIGALKKMRAESLPAIEEAIAGGKIPSELVPEIKAALESGIIAKWKVLGPFENVWGAVHPPEEQALKAGGEPDLKAKYVNAEGNFVGWRDENGNQQEGRVDLANVFKTNGMVCAYAYTPIEAEVAGEAKLLCGSDEQIAIWLNGRKVHDSGTAHHYLVDGEEVKLPLKAGVNHLLVKIGNLEKDWVFAARIPGLDGTRYVASKEPAPDVKQRTFALAAKADGTWANPGLAACGEKIFSDPAGPLGGICATCHTVRGKGGQIGPDLSQVAVNYKRPDLVTSILEPSKTIALGFEQFIVTTKAGDVFSGSIRQETNDTFTLLGADNQPHVVKKTDVKEKTALAISLMPQGLTLGLKPEDFADLLAYLETLKGQ